MRKYDARVTGLIAATFSILVSGCANYVASIGVDPTDYEAVRQGVKRSYDSYKQLETYSGPFISTGVLLNTSLIQIGANKQGSDVNFFIQVARNYRSEGWHYYNQFIDSNSNRLRTIVGDRDVESCNASAYGSTCLYEEYIFALVDGAYLRSHDVSGLALRLYSDSGNTIDLSIPGTYISAVLSAIPYAPAPQTRSSSGASTMNNGGLPGGLFSGQSANESNSISAPKRYSASISAKRSCRESMNFCQYAYTLKNSEHSPSAIKPKMKVIVHDCNGNTLEEGEVLFDTINAGKEQTKEYYHKKPDDGTLGTIVTILSVEADWDNYDFDQRVSVEANVSKLNWDCSS